MHCLGGTWIKGKAEQQDKYCLLNITYTEIHPTLTELRANGRMLVGWFVFITTTTCTSTHINTKSNTSRRYVYLLQILHPGGVVGCTARQNREFELSGSNNSINHWLCGTLVNRLQKPVHCSASLKPVATPRKLFLSSFECIQELIHALKLLETCIWHVFLRHIILTEKK